MLSYNNNGKKYENSGRITHNTSCLLYTSIRSRFEQEKPFAGKKITMSIHMEAKTAYLALCLKAGGAEVHATGCNPVSYTHLDVYKRQVTDSDVKILLFMSFLS